MTKSSDNKKSAQPHTNFLVVMVVVLLLAAIAGWSMYFLRSVRANRDEQNWQKTTQKLQNQLGGAGEDQADMPLSEEDAQ